MIPVRSKQVVWYPVDTLYSRTYIVVPLVPRACSRSRLIQVTPGAIRGHITSKPNTVLDASRGGWCPYIGAYRAVLEAEIHAFPVAFDGPTSMNTHQYTSEETTILLNDGTLWANVLGILSRAQLSIRYGETSSLRSDVWLIT